MSIKKQAISGVKWTSVSTSTIAFANLLKISILARFLDKTDFGLMALVTFVLGFMNLFMDMGLTSAILHKQNITKNEYASLYWINIFVSVAIFIFISLASAYLADFYSESELTILIPLMSVSIIFSAVGRQFKTIEQKYLNFKHIAAVEMLSSISGLIVSVYCAIIGYGVYSLVFGGLTQHAVANSIFFFKGIKKQKISYHFNYIETKPFLKIGVYQVGGQVINYFNRDLDILLIGKFFGVELLGGYSLAKQLVRYPMQVINPIITKVANPIFSINQNNIPKLRKYFLILFKLMSVINSLAYGIIAIFAIYIVSLLYGQQFINIVPLVQLFAVLIYLRSMGSLVGVLVITTGKTDYEFYWNIILTFFIPPVIILGSFYSLDMIIIFMILLQLLFFLPSWFFFYKRFISFGFSSFMSDNLLIGFISFVYIYIYVSLFESNIYISIVAGLVFVMIILAYFYTNINPILKVDKYLFSNKVNK